MKTVITTKNIPNLIKCACGCKTLLENKDVYGRIRKFISGHNGRKYKDPTQYKREWNHRNRRQRYIYKMVWARKKKAKLILLLGGQCKNCELIYNGKNGGLFQFHHKNPVIKKFNVNLSAIVDYSWSKILKELKKCKLLCGNCHLLKHSKEF